MPRVVQLDKVQHEKVYNRQAVEGKVEDGAWKLYSVAVPMNANVLSVTLKGEPSDKLKLFLFPPSAKDTSQWRAAPKSRFSLEGASVEKPEAGYWKIGIFGSKVKHGVFRIVVDTKGTDFVKKGLQVTW